MSDMPDSPKSDTERTYASYLGDLQSMQEPDIEATCKASPEREADPRAIHE